MSGKAFRVRQLGTSAARGRLYQRNCSGFGVERVLRMGSLSVFGSRMIAELPLTCFGKHQMAPAWFTVVLCLSYRLVMFRSASDLISLSMQTVFGTIGARMSGGLSSLQSAKNFAVQMWGGGPESSIWLMFSFSCFASSNGFFGRSRLARPLLACHNLSGHDLARLVLNEICNPKRAIQYMELG